MANYIIDPINDADYYTEVRDLLGITDDDLSDSALKSDIYQLIYFIRARKRISSGRRI